MDPFPAILSGEDGFCIYPFPRSSSFSPVAEAEGFCFCPSLKGPALSDQFLLPVRDVPGEAAGTNWACMTDEGRGGSLWSSALPTFSCEHLAAEFRLAGETLLVFGAPVILN